MIKFVLFWDIDGTLLTTARAGIAAWEGSFEAISGRRLMMESFPTAGLTDVEIATLLAKELNDTTSSTIQKILQGYEDRLLDCLPKRQGRVLPGVIPILNQLQSMPWVYSFLLTGNTQRGAAAKLAYYGLNHFFQGGAFSDGLQDRPSIARRAMQMIHQQFTQSHEKKFFVIGDTPHDIHCGMAIDAKTVAVCTGNYDSHALSLHHPWLVLDSLSDTHTFFEKMGLYS